MLEIFTSDELAKYLKIDVAVVRKMAASGEIPAFTLRFDSKRPDYRFTKEGVQEYIEKNRVAKQEVKA